MLIEVPVTLNLSLIDFSTFNFSEVDLSQMGLSEIDLTQAGFFEVDLTKVNLAHVDLTQINLNKVDLSKVDPHLIYLIIFFPYLYQKMKERKDAIERINKEERQNKMEEESFRLESGYYDYHWVHPETEQSYDYRFCFNGDILVRPQEQKENSKKPKDGYRIEILGPAQDGGGFSLIYPVLKTMRLNSDFILDKKKPYSDSLKKRIVKKQKLLQKSENESWEVHLNGEKISKHVISTEVAKSESRLLKKYSKLGAKTLITIKNRNSKQQFVYQIMKEAPGINLLDLLDPEDERIDKPDFQTRLSLFLALVQEVKALHDKYEIIHGDLKPENMCVYRDESTSVFNITLLDFGGSKLIKDKEIKRFFYHFTDPYFAPEQLPSSIEKRTIKIDVHALGQMMKIDLFTTDLQETFNYKLPPCEEVDFIEYNEVLSECEKEQNKALQKLANEMTCEAPRNRLDLEEVIQRLKDIQQALSKKENQAETSVTALEIDLQAKKIDCFSKKDSVDSGLELLHQSSISDSDLGELSDLSDIEDSDITPSVKHSSINLLQLDLNSPTASTFFRHLHEKMSENENKSFYCPPSSYIYSGVDAEGKHCAYNVQLDHSIIVRRQEQKKSDKPKDGYRIEVLGQAEDKEGAFSITYPVLTTICLNSDFTLDKNKSFSNKKRIVKQQKLTSINSEDKWGIDSKKNKKMVFLDEVEKENKLLKAYSKLSAKTLVKFEDNVNNEQFVFQVMKEAPGERLDSFLNLDLKKEILPDFQTRLKIFSALAREIKNLNYDKKIVHCDLKPENIFVDDNGTNSSVNITLIDFGAAVSTQDQTLNSNQFASPFYAAPEQENNDCPTERVDIYALGQMIKKDFLFIDAQIAGMQYRLSELPEDKQVRHRSYKESVAREELSNSERKQKAALQRLAGHMTCIIPEDRWNIDQVIKELDYIQNQIPEQENQNDEFFIDENEEEIASFKSDSNDSMIDLINPSLTSSEFSLDFSCLEEEVITNDSTVLASASQRPPQEENQALTENDDVFPTENEEKEEDLKVEDLIVTQHVADSEESAAFERGSDGSVVGLANPLLTSSEHRSDISGLGEKRAEDSYLEESKVIMNHSTLFSSVSQSLPQTEAIEKENPAITIKALKQIILLETLEKELANKKFEFCYKESGELDTLVRKIQGYCDYKGESVRAKKTELIQTVRLNIELNNVLIRILEEVSDSQEEVDAFDLSICQALMRYIAQTATPENIQKQDRAASPRRIKDMHCLLDQLHGKSTQYNYEAPKTKLALDVMVEDRPKGVKNRLGFFGKSAVRCLLNQLHGKSTQYNYEAPKTKLALDVMVEAWSKSVKNGLGFFGKSALRSGVSDAVGGIEYHSGCAA